jgi:hypothetical protein
MDPTTLCFNAYYSGLKVSWIPQLYVSTFTIQDLRYHGSRLLNDDDVTKVAFRQGTCSGSSWENLGGNNDVGVEHDVYGLENLSKLKFRDNEGFSTR